MKRTLKRERGRRLSTSGSVCSYSSISSSRTRQRSENDDLENEIAPKVSKIATLETGKAAETSLPVPIKTSK